MREYITPSRIANSIAQKTSFKGTYLIVEGNSDYTFYRKFTSEQFCSIEIAFGNSNVIDVIEELHIRGFTDVIGLIDSDFRNLDGEIPQNPNILMTDEHDLELMIFKSSAFDTVINHHCENAKLEVLLRDCGTDLRSFLLNLSTPLGYLKWANKNQGFLLCFKPQNPDGRDLNYSNFIPVKSLEFTGYDKMVETVINYSVPKGKINTTHEIAVATAKSLINKTIDLYQLCNGHDICQIICLALRSKIGSLNANAVTACQIERELIFAYDSRFFEKTNLYTSIKKWEATKNKTVLSF